MRRSFALMVCAALLTLPQPAHAQGGLLDTLKKIANPARTSSDGSTVEGALSEENIATGLKDALRIGTGRAVKSLSKAYSYNADPAIHIPLPSGLKKIQSMLRDFDLADMADDMELRLNRAAEAAIPGTRRLIIDAIRQMTLDDVRKIFDGPDDAATQYFKRTASADLAAAIKPVVDKSLAKVGALAAYGQLLGTVAAMPNLPDIKTDLSAHTVDYTLKGLFHYLAKEEAAIRNNPAKRTTALLKKVFGGG